jgi:hypothetical protein
MYEYRTLKPVEVTLRGEWSRRENSEEDKPVWGIIHVYTKMSQQTSLYNYHMLTFFFKEEQEGKTVAAWGVGAGVGKGEGG